MTKLTLKQVQVELKVHGFSTRSRAVKGGRAISLTTSKWSKDYAAETAHLAANLFRHADNISTRVSKGRSSHPYDRGTAEYTPILTVLDS